MFYDIARITEAARIATIKNLRQVLVNWLGIYGPPRSAAFVPLTVLQLKAPERLRLLSALATR